MERKNDYLKVYIITVMLFGLLLVYITPPMQVPDENTHFYNSYAIVTGNVFPDTNGNEIGRVFPKQIGDFVDYYQNNSENGVKYTIENFNLETGIEKQTEILEFKEYWNADTNPIAYIGPIIGMCISKVFLGSLGENPYNMLLAGRIANLILFTILSGYALKFTPVLKRTIMLLLLMPETISLASSLSYDALLIPTVFLAFALIMRLYFEERLIKNSEIIVFMLLTIVLATVKHAYFPLLLLAFAIPKSCFISRKQYYGIVCGGIFVALLFFLIYKIPTDVLLQNVKAVIYPYTEQQPQMEYILTHFYRVPIIIINSFIKYMPFYVNSFFGNLGRLQILYPPIFVVLYLIMLVVILTDELQVEVNIRKSIKLLSAMSFITASILIFVGTYIVWTSFQVGIGADYVDGVQGRYFIMCTPFVAMLFLNDRKLKRKIPFLGNISFGDKSEGIDRFDMCMVYVIVCLIIAIFQIILKYWI